jgi:hypothetical protein
MHNEGAGDGEQGVEGKKDNRSQGMVSLLYL